MTVRSRSIGWGPELSEAVGGGTSASRSRSVESRSPRRSRRDDDLLVDGAEESDVR